MLLDYAQAFVPVAGLLINVFIQVACIRCFPRLGLLKSVYAGFAAGLCSILAFYFINPGKGLVLSADSFGLLVVNLLAYFSLGYCYFHFINLGETARRIRILRELVESKAGLSLDEILERYNAGEILERRIGRLLSNGQIILCDGKYYIGKPFVLLIAKIILFMKWMILGKRCVS